MSSFQALFFPVVFFINSNIMLVYSLKFLFFESILPAILPYINNLSLCLRRRLFHLHLRHRRSSLTTLLIDELNPGSIISRNEVYDAAESYLSTLVVTTTHGGRLNISKSPKEDSVTIGFENEQQIDDAFDNTPVSWRSVCTPEKRRFLELCFETESNDKIINSYIPHVLESLNNKKKTTLKVCTPGSVEYWDMVKQVEQHPSTFDTIAIELDLKWDITDDLDDFVKRKEYYKRVGRAWKRGYLLYGPPGTGKSSLVAAMANYIRFDIYDLPLEYIINNNNKDSDYLRRLLGAIPNRSILVIEDIDSTLDHNGKLTVSSGLLNFIDRLWSNCEDERIIVFTTKHDKEKFDEALLRPGRMDMHIHMDYLTFDGFQILFENYLQFKGQHDLFENVKYLMEDVKVTPAEVAQELMKSDNKVFALIEVIDLLRGKKKAMEKDEAEDKNDGSIDEDEDHGPIDDGTNDDDDDDDGFIDEDDDDDDGSIDEDVDDSSIDDGGCITSIDDHEEDGGTSDDEF